MNLENTRYVFAPHPLPTLPIRGSDKVFPVHRIYCVGRNYAEHAIEMGIVPPNAVNAMNRKHLVRVTDRQGRKRMRREDVAGILKIHCLTPA